MTVKSERPDLVSRSHTRRGLRPGPASIAQLAEHALSKRKVASSILAGGLLGNLPSVRHGVVGNISACHADARGSIPRDGVRLFCFMLSLALEFTCTRVQNRPVPRGIGAIGSVRASQARGTGIETQILHFFAKALCRGIGAIGSVRA